MLHNNIIDISGNYTLARSLILPDSGKIIIGDNVDLEKNNLDLSFTVENRAKINHRIFLGSATTPFDDAFSVHYNLTLKNSIVIKGLLIPNGKIGSTLKVLGTESSRKSALVSFDGTPDVVFAENTQIDFESNPFMGCSNYQHGFQDVGNGIGCTNWTGCTSFNFGVERNDFSAALGLHSVIAQSSDVEKMFCK